MVKKIQLNEDFCFVTFSYDLNNIKLSQKENL